MNREEITREIVKRLETADTEDLKLILIFVDTYLRKKQ